MSEHKHTIARAHGAIGEADYRVALQAGRHALAADEPASRGGADAGPAPYELVLSGLVACTAITLRTYAQRKGWAAAGISVDALLVKQGDALHIERSLLLDGALDAEQRTRLLEIAEKTPVTLTLKNGLEIRTTLQSGGEA
jgi:putative redox protein